MAGRQTVSHVADTRVGAAVPDESKAVPSGDLPWRGAREAVGLRTAASTAAVEEKFEVRVGRGRGVFLVDGGRAGCAVWPLNGLHPFSRRE